MKELLNKIDSYKDYLIHLEKGLTAHPAIAPESGGFGEIEKCEWLEKELRKLPFDEIHRIDAADSRAKGGVRPNLIARYKGFSGSKKTLWIMSHLDVVPPGDLSKWNSNPYEVKVEGNKIYGRGVEDNQQGMVASILTVKAMMEIGVRPPCDIALLFAADEETGSEYGADFLVDKHPDIFSKQDAFLVPDGGLPDGTQVEIAEKSILWLKIKTFGKSCHGSTPAQGINSFRAASELVVKLQSLYEKFNWKDELYDPQISTFEPTKKEANVPNINTIPGEDVFYMDCRVLPNYKLKDVKDEVKKLASEIENKYKVKIEIEAVQEAEAAPPTSKDAEIVTKVIESVKEIYNVKAKPEGIGGGTVAACFRRLNLPAVVYSKQDETMHQPNEYAIIDNILGDAKVFALTAMKMKAE